MSAVTATTLSRLVYGSEQVFSIPPMQLESLLELPYVMLMGIVLGCIAALFIHLLQRSTTLSKRWPIWIRCTLGGGIVGIIGMVVPEVMGIGYDTVNQALLGQLALSGLLLVTAAKIIASALGLGLGLPGGLIGPTLVIGALAGGATGIMADTWLPGDIAAPAFYALIGMCTMMGATLQAPLAALTALLELTANPHIILPGMLALITAVLVCREAFGKESVYLILMKARGLDYRDTPITQALRRIGVASVMERRYESLAETVDHQQALDALANEPRWILITRERQPQAIMPAADLAREVREHPQETVYALTEIPAERRDITAIDFQSTLQEALQILNANNTEALYVTRSTIPGISRIYGILTREDIYHSYRVS
jgi:CBS domain-containing protein